MRRNNARVQVKVGPNEVCVLINGLPHVMLRRKDLTGIQSYWKTSGSRETLFFLEFTLRHGPMICDYAERDLWEEILSALLKSRLFDHMLGSSPLPGSA